MKTLASSPRLVSSIATTILFVTLNGCRPTTPADPQTLNATPNGHLLINGAGATFPYPIYSKWFDEYRKQYPNIEINYQSIGSGGGIRQTLEGTVDFGATDLPMSNEQLQQ